VRFSYAGTNPTPKEGRARDPAAARGGGAEGWFVWIDLDLRTDGAEAVVDALGCVPAEVREDAASREPTTQVARYESCLHVAITACRMGTSGFELDRVDPVAGEPHLPPMPLFAPPFTCPPTTPNTEPFTPPTRTGDPFCQGLVGDGQFHPNLAGSGANSWYRP